MTIAFVDKTKDFLEKRLFWFVSALFFAASLYWSYRIGLGRPYGTSLAVATSGASFCVGSLIGFFFSIFGDEVEPLGKIRDTVIALGSGIAGLSIANLARIKAAITTIPLIVDKSQVNPWFAVMFVVFYFIAGFYFMYLMRKLVLNPALAKSTIELSRIQGSLGSLASDLSASIPHSLLLGRDYIGEVVAGKNIATTEFEEIEKQLSSKSINDFLNACDKDIEQGRRVPADTIQKAAIVHYYKTYFEKDEDQRRQQQLKAVEWIQRALMIDPLDPLLQVKLGDAYFALDRVDEAVAIFERLERDDDAPQFVPQWLGYFLLSVDGREKAAIHHSLAYHARFPDESAGLLNAACGYSQLYTKECALAGVTAIPSSENRKKSLEHLRHSIRIDPSIRRTARDNTGEGESFDVLGIDPEFREIVGEDNSGEDETSGDVGDAK